MYNAWFPLCHSCGGSNPPFGTSHHESHKNIRILGRCKRKKKMKYGVLQKKKEKQELGMETLELALQ
jgi:hypothetical protein